MARSFWQAALVAACLLLAPGQALAASCCGGASATDAFVIPKNNKYLAGATVQLQHDFDARDATGKRYRLRSWHNTEAKVTLGGTVRLHKDIQATISVPWTIRQVTTGSAASLGTGPGDIGLQARYEILDEETCFLVPVQNLSWHDMKPTIHWVVKGSFPTGRSAAQSSDPLGADVTSQGYWLMDTGLEITKIWGRFGNSASALLGYQTPAARADTGTRPLPSALRIGADASLMVFLAYKQSIGLSVSHRRQHWIDNGGLQRITTAGSLFTSLIFPNNWLVRANTGPTGWLNGVETPVGWQGSVTIGHLW